MYVITQLPPERVDEYIKIRFESLQTDPDKFLFTHQEALNLPKKIWSEWLPNMYFAFDPSNHTIVGMIGLINRDTDYPLIVSFYVPPDMRGKGIGTMLLKHLQSLAHTKHYKGLTLDVITSATPAIKLYKKVGFVITGTKDNKYIMQWNVV